MSALITKILTWLNSLVSTVTNQFSGDLSLDFLAVIFFLVVMLLIAFSLGRNRIVVAIISTYLAAFIYLILPWSNQIRAWLSLEQVFWVNLGIFALAWLICYSVLVSSVLRSRASLGDSSVLIVLLLSIVETGFLFSIAIALLKVGELLALSPVLLKYFGATGAAFAWMLLPLVVFLFLKRRRSAVS